MPSYRPQAKTRCCSVASSEAIAWLNGTPACLGTTSREPVVRTASSASPHGSGRITMPGPPPYGLSSTVRCTSWVQSRRSCTSTRRWPVASARPTSDSSNGARYSGKIVTTSTFTNTSFDSRRNLYVEKTVRRIQYDLAAGDVHFGHDGPYERDQPGTAIQQPHDKQITRGRVIDAQHLTEVFAVGQFRTQAHQLVVVELLGIFRCRHRGTVHAEQHPPQLVGHVPVGIPL